MATKRTIPWRWRIAGLLMLATIINYLDRSCLGVAAPTLKKELHIDEAHFSYIITAFQLSYMVAQPIGGRIIDWLGTRTGFLLAVIWWSVANMLHGFAGGWKSFAFFRAVLGVGEAGNFPGAIKAVSEWFPAKERTMATGVFNVGSSFGAMLAPPLVTVLILKFGWQSAFVVTGATGFIWVILWYLYYQSPEKHKGVSKEELALIREGTAVTSDVASEQDAAPTKSGGKGVWKIVLSQRNFWGIAIARFLAEPAWQFFVYWIPLYLATERGLNLKQIAYFAWLPFLAGDLGCLFGGYLSPFFQKVGLKVLTARKCAATVSAITMIFAIFIGQATTPAWAVFFFCVGSFAHQSLSSTLLTLPADLFPKNTVASANGLTGGLGYFGGMIFTLIIGYVAMRVGYGPLFTVIAFLDCIGAIFIWTLLREPKTAQAK